MVALRRPFASAKVNVILTMVVTIMPRMASAQPPTVDQHYGKRGQYRVAQHVDDEGPGEARVAPAL